MFLAPMSSIWNHLLEGMTKRRNSTFIPLKVSCNGLLEINDLTLTEISWSRRHGECPEPGLRVSRDYSHLIKFGNLSTGLIAAATEVKVRASAGWGRGVRGEGARGTRKGFWGGATQAPHRQARERRDTEYTGITVDRYLLGYEQRAKQCKYLNYKILLQIDLI